MLELIETVARLRASRYGAASPQGRLRALRALVPTMGALHAGHAELIRQARRESDAVVVSIFVNPLQFTHQDDLARYPRSLESDLALCRDLGVDIVFAPSEAEVYPQPPECRVEVGRLADHLCGKFRPGHFSAVATVVLKLFQMAQPHRAYFGEKDAQQLAIIRRLVADFNLPIDIIEVPTVREPDGLAMSSRNRHLNAGERARATLLYAALGDAKRQIARGERNVRAIRQAATHGISQHADVKLEYFEIVDPGTMQPVAEVTGTVRVVGAMWVGKTRLIDNVLVRMLRTATAADAPALARIINDAFIVEAFFKIGDRTSAEELVSLMHEGGEFLVIDAGDGMAGCVYLRCRGDRAYFGMLSVDPAKQGQGLGRALIDAVEARARQHGCRFMDIHIVNLREELPAYYRRLGYVEQGTLPFSAPERASRPCHFIVMTKPLSD